MDRAKIIACLSGLLLASCSGPTHITVGSKNFTEQVILGEILAQQIERRTHILVERRLSLGGTMLAHEALLQGSLDLYPEYTGTALMAVLKRPPATDPAAVLAQVRAAYEAQWKLTWMPPLGFNNTFAMIVRGDTARDGKVATLSDAASKGPWRLGVGSEFEQRADGLPGLLKTYGMRSDGTPVTMDLGLLYEALNTRKVNMIAANSTDGQASVLDVKILEDDRHFFPPYECAVIVRDDSLLRYPGLRAALEELSGKINVETMRRLNHAVDGERRQIADVAGDFLKSVQ